MIGFTINFFETFRVKAFPIVLFNGEFWDANHLPIKYLPIWILFLPSSIHEAPWQEIALQGVYQGIIAAFIAGFMIAYAARTIGSTRQAAIMSGAPAMALLMAIPLLNEIPSWLSVGGVIIVTIGILMTLGLIIFKAVFPSNNKNNI